MQEIDEFSQRGPRQRTTGNTCGVPKRKRNHIVKDVPELLNNAQIFAFTSQTEGFQNALAEALAQGCACISYDCITGSSKLISDGENGLLVELDNEAEYFEKLSLLIQDEDLRKRFSLFSHTSVEKYGFKNILSMYDGLIKTCGTST